MIELRSVECCVTCDREMYGESFCVYCSFDELGAKYSQALTELARLRAELTAANERIAALEAGDNDDTKELHEESWSVDGKRVLSLGLVLRRFAKLRKRIRQLEAGQGWEPVTDGKIDDDITVTNNGRRIWLDDELGTYLAFTDDYCLMRRRPQEEGQGEA